LADGRRFLYNSWRTASDGYIVLVDADGTRSELLQAVSPPLWVEPDWLLFVRESTLLAQRIDLSSKRAVGEPLSILGAVAYSAATGWANVSASSNGMIAAHTGRDEARIAWFDRTGAERSRIGGSGGYFTLRLSPDDSTLLFSRMRPELGTLDIWTTDLARSNEARLTTSPGMETGEAWLPSGRAVVYAAAEGGPPNLAHKDLATGVERRLLTSTHFQFPNDVTIDGKAVVYQQRTERGDWDLAIVPLDDPGKSSPLLSATSSEFGLRFSPEGKHAAFVSDESGRPQVYVAPFPLTGTKIAVSSIGGSAPRWSRGGRELYFISGARQLMAAPIDASGTPGTARPLFDVRSWGDFDVSRDGRFVAVVSETVARDQPVTVILNWRPPERR
jgi:Tol biopolymer transport system component